MSNETLFVELTPILCDSVISESNDCSKTIRFVVSNTFLSDNRVRRAFLSSWRVGISWHRGDYRPNWNEKKTIDPNPLVDFWTSLTDERDNRFQSVWRASHFVLCSSTHFDRELDTERSRPFPPKQRKVQNESPSNRSFSFTLKFVLTIRSPRRISPRFSDLYFVPTTGLQCTGML